MSKSQVPVYVESELVMLLFLSLNSFSIHHLRKSVSMFLLSLKV